MAPIIGAPSDDAPEVLATGRSDITTIFVSMSARHPEGLDADYLQWHTLDHRPEQYRLAALRAALRFVSTPACRAARAASDARYDDVDHVMTYLWAGLEGLPGFGALGEALRNAGRIPYLLPSVEMAVYQLEGMVAAPRIKIGADVLPWWPMRGVYLLVERGEAPVDDLLEVPGVAGAWWGPASPVGPPFTPADIEGLRITYCCLDDDPPATAERLRPALEKRWAGAGVVPLLAAPFHALVPHDWERHLP